MWLTLLGSARAWVGLGFVVLAGYGALQHVRLKSCQAEFAQFRSDTESLGAAAKVAAARQEALQAKHAQEAISDLQARYDALSARYSRLRSRPSAGSGGVPALSSAAPTVSTCPGSDGKSDAAARLLGEVESRVTAILEVGDRELAKYRSLWELERKNAQTP